MFLAQLLRFPGGNSGWRAKPPLPPSLPPVPAVPSLLPAVAVMDSRCHTGAGQGPAPPAPAGLRGKVTRVSLTVINLN